MPEEAELRALAAAEEQRGGAAKSQDLEAPLKAQLGTESPMCWAGNPPPGGGRVASRGRAIAADSTAKKQKPVSGAWRESGEAA